MDGTGTTTVRGLKGYLFKLIRELYNSNVSYVKEGNWLISPIVAT